MLPERGSTTHPGEVLSEEFLKPLGITQVQLAARIGVPVQRINEIVNGKRGISADTAVLLSKVFGTTPQFWMNLQSNFDLSRVKIEGRIKPFATATH